MAIGLMTRSLLKIGEYRTLGKGGEIYQISLEIRICFEAQTMR